MKQYLLTALQRGLMAASGGPVVLAIIYITLGATGQVDSLTPGEVSLAILTISLLAFIAGAVSVVYQIEQLPLLPATLIHAVTLYLDYLLIYLVNNWLQRSLKVIGTFTLGFAAGYAVIWGIILLSIRLKTNRVNHHLSGGKL